VESRILINSTHVGRFMGIPDVLVETPLKEANNATGGTTESGISRQQGPWSSPARRRPPGFDKKVSVAVDLSIAGADRPPWCSAPPGCSPVRAPQTGPVPEDKTQAVLHAFSTSMPGLKLPFGIAPTSEGARGSDVIVEGIAEGVTITLNEFN
jgi:hypothetical protein